MRHQKKTIKLGRTSEHRRALFANLAQALIKRRRIITTLQKAKALRPFAEKLVTLGKDNTLAARRLAAARLHARGARAGLNKAEIARWRKGEDVVRILFEEIAPAMKDRQGGYTRIYKLGRRRSDSSEMSIIEWVNYVPPAPPKAETDEKPAAKRSRKKAAVAAGTEETTAEAKKD